MLKVYQNHHGGDFLHGQGYLYQKHINICINFTTEVEYYMCHCLESTAQSSKVRQVVEVNVRLWAWFHSCSDVWSIENCYSDITLVYI